MSGRAIHVRHPFEKPSALLMILLAAMALAWLATPRPLAAAGLTVTTTADEVAVNGECSLREAVIAANTNAPVDSCAPGSATELDIITLTGTSYELTIAGANEDAAATGDLDILDDTSIEQVDFAHVTFNGGGLDRIFDVAPATTFIIQAPSTLTGGDAGDAGGGAIRKRGACPMAGSDWLRLVRVVVSGNQASFGGGIAAEVCTFVEGDFISVVDNVAATQGGGISAADQSTVVLRTSTISGNEADIGGGLWAENVVGGGLYSSDVAENVATTGGGIMIPAASATFFTLSSTLLAYNEGGDCDLGASLQTFYTLASDDTCQLTGTGDLPSTDPLLLPRDTNPVAYRLAAGSPAIDGSGGAEYCTGEALVDAYGNPRPQDGDGDGTALCDVGVYEAPGVAPPTPAPTPAPTGAPLPNTATGLPAGAPSGIFGLVAAAVLVLGIAARVRRALT